MHKTSCTMNASWHKIQALCPSVIVHPEMLVHHSYRQAAVSRDRKLYPSPIPFHSIKLCWCLQHCDKNNNFPLNMTHPTNPRVRATMSLIGPPGPTTPERAASADDTCLVPRLTLHRVAAEERVVLDALLPEVLALIPRLKVELHRVLVIALEINRDIIC